MEIRQVLTQMKTTGEAILKLVEGLNDEQEQCKPDPDSWSIKEVISHLAYEEIFDFRFYIGQILSSPAAPELERERQTWKENHPNQEQALEDLALLFKTEREKSIAWLSALENPDWDRNISFSWGSLKAGDFLVSWLAHDLLHLRQLIELRYGITANSFPPYNLDYAGEW